MIPASELASIRDTFAAWRSESCEIRRPVRVTDNAGGYTISSLTLIATVSCNRTGPSTASADEGDAGSSRLEGRVEWVIGLPNGQDVRLADRLIIGGRTYEVNGLIDRSVEIQRYVVATELRGQV